MSRDWRAVGTRAHQDGDLVAAEAAFTSAIDDAETRAGAMRYELYAARSAVRHDSRQFGPALDDADRCVFLKPSYGIGHFRMGQALEGLGRLSDALDAYKAGLIHEPDNGHLADASADLAKHLQARSPGAQRDRSESDRYAKFLDWLRAGGAEISKVVLREYDDEHRGVHTACDVAPDEVFMSIPRHLMITSEMAIQSAIGKAIIRSGVEIRSRHSFLAAYLLQERDRPPASPSRWAPYLAVLPRRFDNIPINFSREELSYLKGSMAVDKIENRIETLQSEYARIAKNVAQFAQFSYKDFVWARCVVITRIFGVTIDGRKTEALVPLADFLNHRRPRETVWMFDPQTSAFTITAVDAINAGFPVSDSYGRKCNSRFFTNYGFSLEDNEDNEAIVRLACDMADPALTRKLEVLGEGSDAEVERSFSVPAMICSCPQTDELVSFLRLSCATDEELDEFAIHTAANVKRIGPISCRNEIAALRMLKEACLKSLAAFETSLEEDDEELASSDLTNNIRNAIVMRRGEKRVLHFFIEFVDDMVPLLSLPKSDMRWIFKSCQRREYAGTFDLYITSVVEPLVEKRDESNADGPC
ncbi:SET domain-containing protein [Plasmodiophora brassicae]|uniref:SET domain-containing protein n=1 Tax=Plasmodiophora brassicae TaxID=37360 RepID=A0A0G4IUN4_PLABS|nr:hypothetical protein PBRA_007099 [Plasmodiophora brassicae]